jgi:hypothetical protein
MHTATIHRIATDCNGRWAVTASNDKTARVATGRHLGVLRVPQDVGDEGKLYAVAMSPGGEMLVVGGWTALDWRHQVAVDLLCRATQHMQRCITGLPEVINHIALPVDELAPVLRRNPEVVRQNYARPLMRDGRLVMTQPAEPNDPHQAYRTVEAIK